MNTLPSSIETSLEEAGFSSTEILVIRRLIEEEGLTLRQLAAKTGKSTGVLDQATKKLLSKGILAKEEINGMPKYVLQPLSTISRWIEADMIEKRETMKRKFQNFESFIRTIEIDKKRPDMSFFDGREGIVNAYRALLDLGKEFRHYMPLQTTIEDDPLRDFMVEYFRERRRRGIFSRVIAHNTPLGRRYQSRDPFEYRKTILVPEQHYPFTFEKVLVGDTIACFNHREERACFIKFPDLAESERLLFEHIWRAQTEPQQSLSAAPSPAPSAPLQPEHVPLATRTFSALRDFFLSPKSLVTFAVFAVIAAGLTVGFYRHTEAVNFQRIRERVQAVAATAAFQFDANDLEALRVETDWKKPQWAKVVNQLKDIKDNNHDLLYAYIFRKKVSNPQQAEFISDADSLNPYANFDQDPNNDVDMNRDGKIEPRGGDLLAWPGQDYPTAPKEALQAYYGPTSNEDFYEDQWGKVITGYAPIKDRAGKAVAVVAVDINARTFETISLSSFSFLPYFLLLFLFFIFLRLFAFNRSLVSELWHAVHVRKFVLFLALAAAVSFGITYAMYRHSLSLVKQEVGERLLSIAATGALQFDANDIKKIHWAKDMKTPEYQRVFQTLNDIRSNNKDVKWAYIQRATATPLVASFVADADTNWNLLPWDDYNQDGTMQPDEQNTPPGFGQDYSENPLAWTTAQTRASAESDFYVTQWGTYLSGYAPIKDISGKTEAVFGVDIDVEKVIAAVHARFSPWLWFTGLFATFVLAYYFLIRRGLAFSTPQNVQSEKKASTRASLYEDLRALFTPKVLLGIMILSFIGLLLTTISFFYALHLRTQEVGEKLAAMAAVVADQVNAADLEKLHSPKDMKTPEYQRLFQLLNDVRGKSADIKYAYILRPTGRGEYDWEFVADADANWNLPMIWNDANEDGVVDNNDTNVHPGFGYDISQAPSTMGTLFHKEANYELMADQWGSYVTGAAPILSGTSVVAVLGLDIDRELFESETAAVFLPFQTLLLCIFFVAIVFLFRSFTSGFTISNLEKQYH